jgi:cobalt-precorrin 5A hydrolase/precorrin-3B C17-methyltransferase
MKIAVVVLGARGLDLARTLAAGLDDARIHGLAGRADGADTVFHDTMAHLRALHRDGIAIIGICAAGILIRAVAATLDGKHDDAPVVALAEDGSVAVPLIGGHHGANRIARQLATLTGGIAAITNAGDLRFGFALDDPPAGWRIANPALVKPVTAALLSGEGATLGGDAPWRDGDTPWLDGAPWLDGDTPGRAQAAYRVLVTARCDRADDRTLVIHPAILVVGVGCERGTDPAELRDLVAATLAEANLAPAAVAAMASLDLKMDEPAMHEAARALDAPLRFFTAAELEAEAPRLQNPSDIVFAATGCHGVAEGAALALAGPDAVLVVAKRKSARATCAVAQANAPIDPVRRGRPRGHLMVVGIGPGGTAWRSPEATAAVEAADVIVGYRLYLDLLADLAPNAERREYGLGQESERVCDALSLASEGMRVALVCSGDAGIYALASLVFEMIDTAENTAWRRVAVDIVPGISAMQAAAARAGAPLGHDFCAISLSDLLTPRAVILRRLEAASSGDFVTALYNPRSKSRRDLLVRARDILAANRLPSTPVVIARNLGRADESVTLATLATLDLEAVDMLTILIIGNRQTRLLPGGERARVYTPRGYEGKR